MIKVTEKVKHKILQDNYAAYLDWFGRNSRSLDGIELIFKSGLCAYVPWSAEPTPLQFGQYCYVISECGPFVMKLNIALREKLNQRVKSEVPTPVFKPNVFQRITRLFYD